MADDDGNSQQTAQLEAAKDQDAHVQLWKEEQERKKREKEQQEQEEFDRKLEESRREANREREQEILKKQQEARDFRQKKKQEQMQRQREQEEVDRDIAESKRAAELERQQEILKKQQAARDLRAQKREEQRNPDQDAHVREYQEYTRKKKERQVAGDMFGFTPKEPIGSQKEMQKSTFEAAENAKMWQEIDDMGRKPGHEPPKRFKTKSAVEEMTGPFMPSFGSAMAQKAKVGAKKFVINRGKEAKFHYNQSLNDSFRVPLGLNDPKTGKRAVRKQGVTRVAGPALRGLGAMIGTGRQPTGLLYSYSGMPSPRATRPFLLFGGGGSSTARRGKKGSKRKKGSVRSSVPGRGLLDRLLWF